MPAQEKNILIVDDSVLILERLSGMLNSVQHTAIIRNAMSYDKAVELIDETLPDIAVLDINLPGKSGIEILDYIKKRNSAVVVIMLTNQSGYYYKNLCHSLGADYFLDKSLEFETVPRIIEKLL